jgi:hypothetical protein
MGKKGQWRLPGAKEVLLLHPCLPHDLLACCLAESWYQVSQGRKHWVLTLSPATYISKLYAGGASVFSLPPLLERVFSLPPDYYLT